MPMPSACGLGDPSHAVGLSWSSARPSERARQTLEGICWRGSVRPGNALRRANLRCQRGHLLEVLREVPDSVKAVLMIGHAPAVPVLATSLAHNDSGSTDVTDRLSLGFPTSGLAVLGFDGPWRRWRREGIPCGTSSSREGEARGPQRVVAACGRRLRGPGLRSALSA